MTFRSRQFAGRYLFRSDSTSRLMARWQLEMLARRQLVFLGLPATFKTSRRQWDEMTAQTRERKSSTEFVQHSLGRRRTRVGTHIWIWTRAKCARAKKAPLAEAKRLNSIPMRVSPTSFWDMRNFIGNRTCWWDFSLYSLVLGIWSQTEWMYPKYDYASQLLRSMIVQWSGFGSISGHIWSKVELTFSELHSFKSRVGSQCFIPVDQKTGFNPPHAWW